MRTDGRRVLAGILIIGIFIFSLSSAEAITKQRAGDVLRAELNRYYDGHQTLLSLVELSDLLTFYLEMPAQGDVDVDSTNLNQRTKNMLILPTTSPSPGGTGGTGGNNNILEQGNLLNGRPNGAWCERDDICGSRNCSSAWNVCMPNSNLNAGTMKNYGEACTNNNECKTGRCFGNPKICRPKPCFKDGQCESGNCLGLSSGVWGIDYNSLTSSYAWYENKAMKVIGLGSCNFQNGALGY